jgi:AIPR protein
MQINKSIIDQRISKIIIDNPFWFTDDKIVNDEGKKTSRAFLMLGIAAYLDISLDEAFTCLTDEGNDAGIDAIYIGDTTDTDFNVVLFQSKYYTGKKMQNDANFEENAIVKMLFALNLIFDTNATITFNDKLKRKIAEIQSLSYNDYLIPQVKCVMLSNGIKWTSIAQQKIDNYKIQNKYTDFDFFNHDDILHYIQIGKNIKADLKLIGKAFTENLPNFKRVLVGKINVAEIANLFEKHHDNLLERNIRKYLGLSKNIINVGIKDTLLGDKKENFYLYNNGITMICSKFRENGFATDWIVKVEDLQIINGGQTCRTIQQTLKEHPNTDFSAAHVMLRLYEIDKEDEQIITDITISTNSQSPVDLRDLKSNDIIQKKLETAIGDLGYMYRRKRENIFQNSDSIASSVAAEAVLTIWRQYPNIAKYKRTDLFGRYYDTIFKDINASQVIIAVLVFRYCDNQRRREALIAQYPHLPYSNYLMAMLLGQLLLKANNLRLENLTHKNFQMVKTYFEQHKEHLFDKANQIIIDILQKEYGNAYTTIELRKLAATFRKNEMITDSLKKIIIV